MSALSLVFAPQLPWWLLALLAIVALLLAGIAFWRRARGAIWRAVFLALLLAFLANPILRREERAPLDDLVLLLSDHSPSQSLADRPTQLATAAKTLQERLARLPGVEVREVTLDGDHRQGSLLFSRLREAMAESDRARLGAVIALTDGQIHDAPTDPAAVAGARYDPQTNADIAAYEIAFTYCIEGRPLRGSLYPALPVLFRRGRASFVQDGHTEKLRIDGQVRPLRNRLLHDDRKSLERWLQSQARYQAYEAEKLSTRPWSDLGWADRPRYMADVNADIDEIYGHFPALQPLRERTAGYLSGGEMQMLLLGRALMARPRLLLLDEPSMGLAPRIVHELFERVAAVRAQRRMSVLLVEQNARAALRIADHGYVMENGRIVLHGSRDELESNEDIREFYLGLGGAQGRRSYRDVKHYKRRKRWLG